VKSLAELQAELQSLTNACGYLDARQQLNAEQIEAVDAALARVRAVLIELRLGLVPRADRR
jgi:hypothetical protein